MTGPRWQCDASFARGDRHRVCQDYAAASVSTVPWAVVSDGCSSSPRTDVGARLLSLAAEAGLAAGAFDLERAIRVAAGHAAQCGLPTPSLDATLLAIDVTPTAFRVRIAGDGAVAGYGVDGTIEAWLVETGDAPPYPSYLLDASRQRAWEALGIARVFRHVRVGDDDARVLDEHPRPLVGGFAVTLELPFERFAGVAVSSDGYRSFRDTERRPVSVAKVLHGLLATPSFEGCFLERRVSRFLRREAPRRGWTHHDDVAAAAVVDRARAIPAPRRGS